MKKHLLILAFLLILCDLRAQKFATKRIWEDPFHFGNFLLLQDGRESFIISKYKTTNKDYLCFLQWTYRVYGEDYPEIYKEMLPDTIIYPDIFNPDKLNMPVKGITKKQAQAFCYWRSDRLNEYILIREGILNINLYQYNENNFNTESYLSGQYEGSVKNDIYDVYTKKVRLCIYSDFILIPGFYIASKGEVEKCCSLLNSTNFKIKKRIKSDLDLWFSDELELILKKTDSSPLNVYKSRLSEYALSDRVKIYDYLRKYQRELAKEKIDFDTTNVMFSEKDYRLFNLYKYKSQMRYYKLLSDSLPDPFRKDYPRIDKKNKFGKMDFVYIADNYDGTPICINKSVFEDNLTNDISKEGFYCAMNIPYRLYLQLQEYSFIEYYLRYRY